MKEKYALRAQQISTTPVKCWRRASLIKQPWSCVVDLPHVHAGTDSQVVDLPPQQRTC